MSFTKKMSKKVEKYSNAKVLSQNLLHVHSFNYNFYYEHRINSRLEELETRLQGISKNT